MSRIRKAPERPKHLKFGDVVVVSGVYRRNSHYVDCGTAYGLWRQTWDIRELPALRTGILIGFRTLYEGISEEQGRHRFSEETCITTALVVFNDRENPRYVPITHITNDLEKLPCLK